MVLASTSEKGCCSKCGKPWDRIVEKSGTGPQRENRKNDQIRLTRMAGQAYQDWKEEHPNVTVGWKPTCECKDATVVPCVVLDTFGGSGTTGLVAAQNNRNAVLLELNPEYCQLAEDRINKELGLLTQVERI
jgi:hypothetical protein